MAGKVVDVTLRLIDKVSAPLNAVGGKLAQSANQWTKAGKQIQSAGRSMEATGKLMTKSLTVPIATAGTACIKLASDFETGMSKVQAISGATGKELDLLAQKAKEMGAKTKFSAREATEAYQYMAMAGWKAEEMMAGIEGIMYLAGATGEDLAQTSDIVTDALTAFGMKANETQRFVDVLAQAANSTNTNVAMLGESFQYVAPIAGALKYSVEDVGVALGLMANSGIKASQAGTSMRSWLSRMASPTKEVSTAMSLLGISMTDSSGNMKSLAVVMQETRSAFAKLTETEKTHYASVLAGKTGMSGLLAVVNSAESDFDQVTKAINNSAGACKKMYDVANDNLQGQLTILKSTLESVAISFGEIMLPRVKETTTWLQKLADKFNSLSIQQKENVVKWATITAAIGPVILIFGKMVSGVGRAALAIGKLGTMFKTFGSLGAIVTSPAGIVIAVIAAIALGAALIIKNWEKIKPWLQNVKKWFVDSFGGTGGAFDKFKQAFGTVAETVAPIVERIVNWFSAAIPKGIEVLKKAFEKIGPIIEKAVIFYINALAANAVMLANAFQKAVPIVGGFIKNALEKIAPIVQSIIGVMKQVLPIVGENLSKCIQSVLPVLKSLGELFGAVFTYAGERIMAFWKFISPIVSGIISTVASIVEKLQPTFTKGFDIVGKIVVDFSNKITTIFTGIMGVINGLITFITGVFTGNWKKAWEGVKGIFGSIFSSFAELAKGPINAVIGIINRAISSLNRIHITIPEWVPTMGGKSFGVNIPTVPTLAVGTDNWKGGIVQISEKGGEIVDLPSGTRVYPHDESVAKAYNDGAKSSSTNINIEIPKLADKIVVRDESDIDKIAQALADKLEKVSLNLGGEELGYLY